ncbi:MAG TPA: hypothetical protein VML75_06065 [Kofleriaceae bacterium]|nr:hypothetical protein [Kofleriaceae bacterium]
MSTGTQATSAWLARVTGWALLALAVATLIRAGMIAEVAARLFHDRGGESTDDILDRLHLYMRVLPPLAIGAAIAVAVLGGLLARSVRGRGAALAACGAALIAIAAVIDTFAWLRALEVVSMDGDLAKAAFTIDIVAGQAGLALLMMAAASVASSTGRALPSSMMVAAAPFLVWPMFYWLAQVHGPSTSESPWVSLFAGHGIWACGVAWVAYILVRAGSREPARAGDVPMEAQPLGREWQTAAAGLRLYADALSWRLALTIIGYVVLLLALLGQSAGLAKLVAWLLPLSLAATAIAMAIGIFRFSRQPGHSPARATAASAFAAMLIGTVLQLWALVLVVRVLGSSESTYRKARELTEQAQAMDTWALALGFLTLVLLLVSFAQLANYLGARHLFGRVVGVGSAIVLLGFAVIGFRAWVSSSGGKVSTMLSMAILVLGFALFVVLAYIQLTRAVEQAIRSRLSDGEGPPVAVVVNE